VTSRLPVLVQGLACALVAAVLLGLAVVGDLPLLLALVPLQLLLVLGFLALVDAPASGGVFLLTVAAAGAADLVVWFDDGRASGLAGVVAVSLVAALLQQLARRERSRVTESLADTFVAVLLVCSCVCLLAALRQPGGTWPVRAGLAAAGIALLAGRVGDAVVPGPVLAYGASRAWPGLLLALGAGMAAAVLVSDGHLATGRGALVGLLAAATVATADLAIDLAGSELTPEHRDARRVAALRPVSVLLPFAVLGPVLLVAVRLLDRS